MHMAEALRARVRLGDRVLDKFARQKPHDTPLRQQIWPHPCPSVLVLHCFVPWALGSAPLFSCSQCTGQRLLSTTCMHNIAWHHIPHIPHSQELFCFTCWLPPLYIHCHFLEATLLCASSPVFCLNSFVFDSVFSYLLFYFSTFGGIFGKFWLFWHFGLLFLILRISAFSPFFRNSHSCWLLFYLVSRFDGLLNIQPGTSFSFQPTPQHTSHPTTPYHLTTAPYHLLLKTSHPTQWWIWVAHTRSGATWGGGW